MRPMAISLLVPERISISPTNDYLSCSPHSGLPPWIRAGTVAVACGAMSAVAVPLPRRRGGKSSHRSPYHNRPHGCLCDLQPVVGQLSLRTMG